MQTLGEILAQFDDGGRVASLLAGLDNPALLDKLNERANAFCMQPGEVAVEAVRAFSSKADDEAWLKLLGRVQDAQSPAAACLMEMLTWALKQ